MNVGNSENIDFRNSLKKDSKNLIIFNTDKFANISSFIPSLKSLSEAFDITLYEQYAWKDQTDKLSKAIRIAPFISSMEKSELNAFNKKFSENFNWSVANDTPRYDLLGYDISSYFISLLTKYGTKLPEKLSLKTNSNWIQSQPSFERRSDKSGFINQQLYLIEDYKD